MKPAPTLRPCACGCARLVKRTYWKGHHNRIGPVQQTNARALAAIRAFLEERGYSPTVQEVAEACGWKSTQTAWTVINRLAQAGHIRHEPRVARSIRVLKWKAKRKGVET